MRRKRIWTAVPALTLVLCLTACGGGNSPSAAAPWESAEPTPKESAEPPPPRTPPPLLS